MKPLIILITTLFLMSCSTPDADQKPNHMTAKFVKMVRPDYPSYAFAHRLTGAVKISFDVGANGKVSELRILKSIPDHLFDDEVIRAVAQWEFVKNSPKKDQQMVMIFRLTHSLKPFPGQVVPAAPPQPHHDDAIDSQVPSSYHPITIFIGDARYPYE